MKCRACGRIMDDNSRFCFNCDCDNYPEMNHVKTKGATAYDADNMQYSGAKQSFAGNHRAAERKTYSASNSRTQSNNAQKDSAKGNSSNPGCFLAVIVAVVWILIIILSFAT